MNTTPDLRRFSVYPLLALGLALAAGSLPAQVAPAPSPASSGASTNPAAQPTPTRTPRPGELVEAEQSDSVILSPFIVNAEEDLGYTATSTLAGTRIKTELKDVGAALSVVTEKFLRDTGARNSEDLLVLTTGTETGSTRGNFSAVNVSDRDTNELPNLTRVNNNTRVRGLGAADNTRDYFLTDIPWDSYNTGRVELQRGPNSILFGLGNPSGIINAGLNPATFKNSGSFQTRIGSYDSYRGSLDVNRVLIKNQLAFRTSLLFDRTEYQQRPAFNQDKRIYAALRYDPAFLAKNGRHFTLRANFEGGAIEQNRPRVLPPIDRFTPWFNQTPVTVPANPVTGTPQRTFAPINRSVYDLWTAYRGYDPNIPGSGAVGSNSAPTAVVGGQTVPNPNYQPGISEIFSDGPLIFFPDPNSSALATGKPSVIQQSNWTTQFGLNSAGNIDQNVAGIPFARFIGLTEPWKLAQFYGRPFFGNYISNSLTDPSIFDFYHQLLDGPNKVSTRDFDAFNIDVSQTFFNNRLGLNVAYDHQDYRDRSDGLYSDRYQAINIDINATLPDGTPNPNVGRPFLTARSSQGSSLKTERESFRVTGFGEFRAKDFMKKSRLSDAIGRHVFTAVYARDRHDQDSRSFHRFLLDQGYPLTTQGINTINSRSPQLYHYIGPDLRGVTNPSGLRLQSPSAFLNPTAVDVRYFDSRWQPPANPATAGYVNPSAVWFDPFINANRTQSENPANYGGWKNYSAQLANSLVNGQDATTTRATLNRNKLETKAFNWQGYFFDGNFVPLFGYRRDTNKVYTTTAPTTPSGVSLIGSPNFVFTTPRSALTTEIRSWGGVLHMPRFLREKLPWGTMLSLTFNSSSNFNPSDAGRVDHLNKPLEPSSGKTEDYGFLFSTMHNKLSIRVNWYRATVKDATFAWSTQKNWIFQDEARGWQIANRLKAGLSGDPAFSGQAYNYFRLVNGIEVRTPEDRAKQEADVAAYFAGVPTELFAGGLIPNPPDATWLVGGSELFVAPYGVRGAPGFEATRDTLSKGVEMEVTYNPTKSWTIFANATQTRAVTSKNVSNLVEWLDKRNAFWNGPAGNLQLFNNNTQTATSFMRTDWNNNVGYPYALQKYSNGASVQEMPKWRVNVTTNYSFKQGILQGAKVGGSYRWIQKSAIGYPWTYLTVAGRLVEVPNIKTPVYGSDDTSVDLWIGYERKLTAKKIGWEIQLNVRNALGENKILPISVQPDGSVAAYRIKEGPSWTLSNTFRF